MLFAQIPGFQCKIIKFKAFSRPGVQIMKIPGFPGFQVGFRTLYVNVMEHNGFGRLMEVLTRIIAHVSMKVLTTGTIIATILCGR